MVATVKGGDGRDYPASAFLYVPDPSKPTTWKIRYKEYVNGRLTVTAKILGAAWAAVTKGFRGNVVKLPPGVKERIKGRINSLRSGLKKSTSEQKDFKREDIEDSDSLEEVVIEEGTEERLEDLFEGPVFPLGEKSVWDEASGTFKGLAMLGTTSKNGRRYRPDVQRDAVKRRVYEGLPCYIDHQEPGRKGGRKVRESAGRWINTRFDETTQRVRGDLKTLKQHRETLIDIYENGPELAAPSHVVDGKVQKIKQGESVIEDVAKIVTGYSVDIVAGAATVPSLKEAVEPKEKTKEQGDMEMTFDIDDPGLTIEKLKEARPDLFKLQESEDWKKKYLEEKKAREALEKDTKLKESQKLLKDELAKSGIPKEGQETIYEMYKESSLDEEGVKKAVNTAKDFLKKCGLKEQENPDPDVDVPSGDPKPKEKTNFSKTLTEGLLKKAGIDVPKEKEKEKED